jgi:hypothetical protein
MTRIANSIFRSVFVAALVAFSTSPLARGEDPRNIRTGLQIPDQGYCDQPYVVITRDGNWLCALTTGPGHEGAGGQHVACTISTDKGQTWSELIDIEPATGPEASWVVPLVTPSGRVYAFYTYNGDRVNTLDGRKIRADMLGWYAFRYSDDNGRTWSAQRHRLPMRVTACDRGNDWQGEVQIFWGICKPLVVGSDVYFSFTKLGKYMLDLGEGWVYRSTNLLSEPDVSKIHWELLPDGDHGIRADQFGSVQEEHNLAALSDGALYCVYRTTTGYPCHTYSNDGGRTWEKPRHMTYSPGGRRIKTPRACPKVWRTEDGKFLFWFHNHSGRSYQDRNPVWISGGIEKNGRIHWSEPEILLYDDDPKVRMSYPDLIQQDGRFWVTETQKTIARIHELDKTLLQGTWNQGHGNTVTRDGLVLELDQGQLKPREVPLAAALDVAQTGGLTLDAWVRFDDLSPGQILVDSHAPDKRGFVLMTTDDGTVRIGLSDGKTKAAWDCDPGLLQTGKTHHIVAILDAGPKIITFLIDGVLCDGGDGRQYGWGRYQGDLRDVSGSGKLRIAPKLQGKLESLRVYSRYLRTSEAIANYHAGPG